MRFNPFLRRLYQIICHKIIKNESSEISKGKQINRHISKLRFYKDKLTEIMSHYLFFFLVFFFSQSVEKEPAVLHGVSVAGLGSGYL